MKRDGFARVRDVDYWVFPDLARRRVQMPLSPQDSSVDSDGIPPGATHIRSIAWLADSVIVSCGYLRDSDATGVPTENGSQSVRAKECAVSHRPPSPQRDLVVRPRMVEVDILQLSASPGAPSRSGAFE